MALKYKKRCLTLFIFRKCKLKLLWLTISHQSDWQKLKNLQHITQARLQGNSRSLLVARQNGTTAAEGNLTEGNTGTCAFRLWLDGISVRTLPWGYAPHSSEQHTHRGIHCGIICGHELWKQPKCPVTADWSGQLRSTSMTEQCAARESTGDLYELTVIPCILFSRRQREKKVCIVCGLFGNKRWWNEV